MGGGTGGGSGGSDGGTCGSGFGYVYVGNNGSPATGSATAYFSCGATELPLMYRHPWPCTFVPNNADAGTAQTSAGTITVLGTRPSVTLTFDGGSYTQYSSSTPLFDGGETLYYQATGAVIPPFSAMSVLAPRPAILISPSVLPFQLLTISISQGLQMAWAPTNPSGTFDVLLLGAGGTIFCSFPLADGMGVLGPGPLQQFYAASDAGFPFILGMTSDSTLVDGGSWQTCLQATSGVESLGGSPFANPVTLVP